MTEILMFAYDYIDLIKSKDEYKEYIKLHNAIETKYQDEIKLFSDSKDKYEEARKYGKYHPDLKELTKNFSEAKKRLYSIDDIIRYNELNSLIEKEVDQVIQTLSSSISNNITVINKYGFSLNKGVSCSGNCG